MGKGTTALQEQEQSRGQHSCLVLKDDDLWQPLSSLTLGNEADAGCCEEEALRAGGLEIAEWGANSHEHRGEHWTAWRPI